MLLFQVRKFFEWYQARDQEVAGLLGLKPLGRLEEARGMGSRHTFVIGRWGGYSDGIVW